MAQLRYSPQSDSTGTMLNKRTSFIVRWTTVAAAGSGDPVLFCAHSEAFNSKYPQSVSGRENIWKGFVHTRDQHVITIIILCRIT